MTVSTSPGGAGSEAHGGPGSTGAGASVSIPRLLIERVRESLSDPAQVLALVLIAAFAVRAIWLTLPQGSLIFDETYYVNAARVLLGWAVPPGGNYAGSLAGLDPNSEHPPLGKLLIALSMSVFGDNGLGWRLPSLIAGMMALAALYRIVRSAGETAWLGVLAVGLFAFDNLALVHGRIGTLDMMVLAFILIGAWLALRHRWMAAGALMALGTLVKLTALYGLLALLILQALSLWETWRRERRIELRDLRPPAVVLFTYVLITFAGLWLLDAGFTSYPGPIDHLRHMFEYGANLKASGGAPGICSGTDSAPWQWLVNDCQINYFRVDVTVRVGEKIVANHVTTDFRGAMNPLLTGALPVAFLFTSWLSWRSGNRLARWAVAWAAANYLPYVALALIDQRVTYIYYFLPVVPAVAVAVAILLRRAGLPRFVTVGYVVAYLVGFAAYFPFRQIP